MFRRPSSSPDVQHHYDVALAAAALPSPDTDRNVGDGGTQDKRQLRLIRLSLPRHLIKVYYLCDHKYRRHPA